MAFPTTGILDSFDRANENPLGNGNWSAFGWDPANPLQIVSFQCVNVGSGYGARYWSSSTFGLDCEVYATIVTKSVTDGAVCSLWLRVQDPSVTDGEDGYEIATVVQSGTDVIAVTRRDNGSGTDLLVINQEFSSGDSFGASIVGSIITVYYKSGAGSWGSIGTYDISGDATKYTTAGNLAISNYDGDTVLDNFGGGTYVEPASTATGFMRLSKYWSLLLTFLFGGL
jgi:hypothetical protein